MVGSLGSSLMALPIAGGGMWYRGDVSCFGFPGEFFSVFVEFFEGDFYCGCFLKECFQGWNWFDDEFS
jgi:hypothetical protein